MSVGKLATSATSLSVNDITGNKNSNKVATGGENWQHFGFEISAISLAFVAILPNKSGCPGNNKTKTDQLCPPSFGA
jgi:hypothetical protein